MKRDLGDSVRLVSNEEVLQRLLAQFDRFDRAQDTKQSVRAVANQYGAKGILKFNPTEAETRLGYKQEVTLVNWESRDGAPRRVSLEFGPLASSGGGTFPQATSGGTNLAYRAYVVVIFSTPATTFDGFFADLGRGQRVVLATSRVTLTAVMPAPQTNYTSGSMSVIGGVSEGGVPSYTPVLFTEFIEDLAAGATSTAVVLPPRATRLDIVGMSATAASAALSFLDNAGTVIRTVPSFANGTQVESIPLPRGAYSVTVQNTGGAISSFDLPFQLSV